MATGTATQGSATTALNNNEVPETEVYQPENEEEEVVLEGDELFMTLSPEEQDSWQRMIQARESSLKTGKERFAQWRDNFNRRRMFAYSRVRKLNESYKQKGHFYSELSVCLSSVQGRGRRARFTAKNMENGRTPSNDPPLRQQRPQLQQQQQQQQQQQLLQQHPVKSQQPLPMPQSQPTESSIKETADTTPVANTS